MKMDQFKDYSKYYDTIYRDKHYKNETNFLIQAFKKYGQSKGRKLLSLGCGTCTYELLVAKKGYKITGIDRSRRMLNMAAKKIKSAKLESKIKILEGNAQRFSFKEKFDIAMAMFNIAGYQTKDKDFEQMVKNVAKSLKKGGIFVFDCWYMPAVLKDRPTDRIKKIKTKEGDLTRITKSKLNLKENLVEINFDVIETALGKVVSKTSENHPMRYWSFPELQYFMNKVGLSIIKTCNFMDMESEISDSKWDIFVVARKEK